MAEAVLTKPNILAILNKLNRSNKKLTLIDFVLKKINTQGMLGLYYNLHITTKSTNNLTKEYIFFVKAPSNLDVDQALKDIVLSKESLLYALFSEMNTNLILKVIPKSYLITSNGTLILEDLTQNNYKVLSDCYKEIGPNNIEIILKSLAILHASSVVYEDMKSKQLGRKYTLLETHSEALAECYYSSTLVPNRKFVMAAAKGVEKASEIYGIPLLDNVSTIFQTLFDLVGPSQKYVNVLSHSDLWLANIMVKQDGDKIVNCKFIDFQFARYGPPARDLMAMIYLITTRAFRKDYYNKMLDVYYESFATCLKEHEIQVEEVMSRKDFEQSCRDERIFGVCGACIWLPTVLLEFNDFRKLLHEDNVQKVYYIDRGIMFDIIERNGYYDTRIKDTLIDLNDFIILEKVTRI